MHRKNAQSIYRRRKMVSMGFTKNGASIIARRKSVREFNETPISDEILSTILWAAYGYINDEKRTVHGLEGYAAKIYVLKEDGVYFYDPTNHSLVFYKEGDYRRRVAQYEAPIQLGIVME